MVEINATFIIHYGMHLIVPAGIAWMLDKNRWVFIYLIFLAAMAIDLDHLLATPIYDPNRCSIGFHPLHGIIAISTYVILIIPAKTRYFGLALCWHIVTDVTDCILSGTLA